MQQFLTIISIGITDGIDGEDICGTGHNREMVGFLLESGQVICKNKKKKKKKKKTWGCQEEFQQLSHAYAGNGESLGMDGEAS